MTTGVPVFVGHPPAKLNLSLEVGQRGEDGYHPLRSVFVRVGLCDRLGVALEPAAARDSLTVTGLPGCPVEGNLVLRAFDLSRAVLGAPLPALAAELDKRIPLGGGLGGGSSDGAAALQLAAAAWGVGMSAAQMTSLALALGSDVPFFAADVAAALVEGRGERVAELPGPAAPGFLLATSSGQLSTTIVFARFDELPPRSRTATRTTDDLVAALRGGIDGGGLAEMAQLLRDANDLWPATASVAPELAARRDALERLTRRPWLLTGSGPTLFAIYPSADEAEAARSRLASAGLDAQLDSALVATSAEPTTPSGRHA